MATNSKQIKVEKCRQRIFDVCKDTGWQQGTLKVREFRSDTSDEWLLQRLTTVRQVHKHRWPFGNLCSTIPKSTHKPTSELMCSTATSSQPVSGPVCVRPRVCVCACVCCYARERRLLVHRHSLPCWNKCQLCSPPRLPSPPQNTG